MKLRIDALDTLFFRDGKPFTSGEDIWADMLFPPLPSVIYGALRSAYLAEQIRTWQKTLTEKTLAIKAIALQSQDILFFPVPLDLVKKKTLKKKPLKIRPLELQKPPQHSNCLFPEIFGTEDHQQVESVGQGIMQGDILERYLNCNGTEFICNEPADYLISEPKIGIKRDNATHTAQDQMLYCIEMKRLKNFSLFVEYTGLSLPNNSRGILRLGGEGKAAAYRPSNAVLPTPPTLSGNRFKLYLATPAIFQAGWRPNWLQATTLQGDYGHLQLKLVTAIIGKPIAAGGFSVEHNKPKPMRKAVPAGSIYVFEIINGSGTMQDALTLFHGKILSDSGVLATLSDEQKQLQQQGFGLTFVGGVQ